MLYYGRDILICMKKIYYISVDDEACGMNAISLVESPAVQYDFLAFNKEEKKIPLKFDNAKHIITGVVCLADTAIYRYNPSMGEYWIVFSRETIEKMIQKYAKEGLYNSVNLQHDDDRFVDGVYMVESYLTNKERGINPIEFSDIPDGSWIASYKIENNELWNEIVNGTEFNGFSLQGIFDLTEQKFNAEPKQEETDTYEEWINNYLN